MTRKAATAAALAVLVHLMAPTGAAARDRLACGPDTVGLASGELRITSGIDSKRAWLMAEYANLHVRKFTAREGASVIEFRYGDDVVVLSLAAGHMTITRNGSSEPLGTSEAVARVQQLLGGSAAMFQARAMLSRLEGTSRLTAPEMSLLSAAAFAATLTGDTGAPLRLADRFVAVHRGIVRPVRLSDSCWTSYSNETTEAWNDYTGCVTEANQGSSWLVYAREQACAALWVMRAESAWFEYLGCLSPLAIVKG